MYIIVLFLFLLKWILKFLNFFILFDLVLNVRNVVEKIIKLFICITYFVLYVIVSFYTLLLCFQWFDCSYYLLERINKLSVVLICYICILFFLCFIFCRNFVNKVFVFMLHLLILFYVDTVLFYCFFWKFVVYVHVHMF